MTRQKEVYVRYFTDRQYGSSEEALNAALRVRESMLAELEQGAAFVEVAARYGKKK